MKKNYLLRCLLLPLYLALSLQLFSQDVAPDPRLLLILETLNDCDQSINSLWTNSQSSSKTINDLQKEVSSMWTIIKMQQNELQQEQMNSQRSEQAAQTKLQNYEATLQSLEKSLTVLSKDNSEKDEKILKLTETKSKMLTAIFIMGGILLAILAFAIIKLVLWIKGGAAASLIKSFIGRAT